MAGNRCRGEPKKNNRNKNIKNMIISIILVLLILFGIAIMNLNRIAEWQVSSISRVSIDDILNSKKSKKDSIEDKTDVSFDFENVQALSNDLINQAFLENMANSDIQNAIGMVAVPSVGVLNQINEGVSDYVLSIGSGTMKPNMEMGKMNYALAGHSVPDFPNLLFTPLHQLEDNALIFITDFRYVYTYTVTEMKRIKVTESQYIEDSTSFKNSPVITLITCETDNLGEYSLQTLPDRLMVRGKLTNTTWLNSQNKFIFEL